MIMLKRLFILVISFFLAVPVSAGVTCSNTIISTGDTNLEVLSKLKKCGKILNKDAMWKESASKENNTINKEWLVEHWYIKVSEQAGIYCYPLTFNKGVLKDIGNLEKCE
jgi:hypothetical protein